ncbi:MAG: GGDEF domain-containing protein [Solirubrobacteraceae bacterium]
MLNGSWLCDEAGRRRLIENSDRIRPQRAAAMALLAAVLILTAHWHGWWPLAPLVVAAAGFAWADQRIKTVARPEIPFAIAWITAQICIATSASLTGGVDSEALMWLAIPIVTVSARLTTHGLIAAVAITEVLLVASALTSGPQALIDDPTSVLFALATVAAVAILSAALMNSDLHHRSKSVIDPLTQMLNRGALVGRATELAEQSRISGDPVAVIVADLDHFKKINDTHGHQTGDAVLRDVAYMIRKELRAFDLAYRLGGEEFLILLPGSGEPGAALVAERLRETIATREIAGVNVTISCGVAASAPGNAFDFDAVFARADYALYAAKKAGRNRVSGTLEERVPAEA